MQICFLYANRLLIICLLLRMPPYDCCQEILYFPPPHMTPSPTQSPHDTCLCREGEWDASYLIPAVCIHEKQNVSVWDNPRPCFFEMETFIQCTLALPRFLFSLPNVELIPRQSIIRFIQLCESYFALVPTPVESPWWYVWWVGLRRWRLKKNMWMQIWGTPVPGFAFI